MKVSMLSASLFAILSLNCAAGESRVWTLDLTNGVRVGSRGDLPRFSWAVLPEGAVRYAESALEAAPASWNVTKMEKFAGGIYTVISIVGGQSASLRYASANDEFFVIGGDDDLDTISRVFERSLAPGLHKLDNVQRYAFCEYLAFLYKGPKRRVLSGDFETEVPRVEAWLGGRAENRAKLLKECTDPSLKVTGGKQQLDFNAITGPGAIEAWSAIAIESPEGWTLERVRVGKLHPNGSFSWGEVP